MLIRVIRGLIFALPLLYNWSCPTSRHRYTDPNILEVETLGALARIPPDGRAEHTEHWFLYRVQAGDSEESIEQHVQPLVRQTDKFKP